MGPTGKSRIVQIHPTRRCNLRCLHCYSSSGPEVKGELPADGSAHGFDNNSEALDISHVNLAKYMEAADYALDIAIATDGITYKSRDSIALHIRVRDKMGMPVQGSFSLAVSDGL